MLRVPVHRRLAAPAAVIFAAAVTAVSAQGVAACTSATFPWSVNAVSSMAGQSARIFIAQTDVHHLNRLATPSVLVVPACPDSIELPATPQSPRFAYLETLARSSHPHAAP